MDKKLELKAEQYFRPRSPGILPLWSGQKICYLIMPAVIKLDEEYDWLGKIRTLKAVPEISHISRRANLWLVEGHVRLIAGLAKSGREKEVPKQITEQFHFQLELKGEKFHPEEVKALPLLKYVDAAWVEPGAINVEIALEIRVDYSPGDSRCPASPDKNEKWEAGFTGVVGLGAYNSPLGEIISYNIEIENYDYKSDHIGKYVQVLCLAQVLYTVFDRYGSHLRLASQLLPVRVKLPDTAEPGKEVLEIFLSDLELVRYKENMAMYRGKVVLQKGLAAKESTTQPEKFVPGSPAPGDKKQLDPRRLTAFEPARRPHSNKVVIKLSYK